MARRSIRDIKRRPSPCRAKVTTSETETTINIYGLPNSAEPFTVRKPTEWGAYCAAMRYLHKRGISYPQIDWTPSCWYPSRKGA